MKRASRNPTTTQRVLVLVDESNVTSSAKTTNRKLDWLKLRDSLVKERELIEMVVYAGLPPAMTDWQAERDKKNKFLHWLRSNGFLVVTKDGSPSEEGHYKANVDVLGMPTLLTWPCCSGGVAFESRWHRLRKRSVQD